MNSEERSLDLRFRGLNEQYIQLKEEYTRIKEEYIAQFFIIDKLERENKDLNCKLQSCAGYIEKINELTNENAELRLDLKNKDRYSKNIENILQLERENQDLTSKLEICAGYSETITRLTKENTEFRLKLQNQEIRRSSNDNLSEFAKDYCAKWPRVLNSLSLFSPHNVLSERYEVDMSTECPLETQTTGKTPQVNPDQSLAYDIIDLKMIESFFLLGVSRTNIGKAGCLPEILYEYLGENTHASNRKILPDFCFPTQFQCKALRHSKSDEEINSILFGQEIEMKGSNCYIFTLRSQDPGDGLIEFSDLPNSEREYIYCVCIQVEDIGIEPRTDIEYINTKCLCLLTYIPAFDMHFKLLQALLQLNKIWRMQMLADYGDIRDSIRKIAVEIPSEWEELLNKYYNYESIRPGMKLTIEVPLIHTIEHNFCEDLSMIDIKWLMSSLISKLTTEEFLWLIAALIQEKSIVFVSYNMNLLTACVLGMQALLRPFKWPNLSITLIPDSLREFLEAPIPILAGLPGTAPEFRKNMTNIIWVYLDDPNSMRRVVHSDTIPNEIQEIPSSFINKDIYTLYKNEAQEANIATHIKNIWTTIIDRFNQASTPGQDFQTTFIQSFSKSEKPFISNLMQTQLFINYFEDILGQLVV